MPGDFPLRGDIYRVEFDPPVGLHYAVVVSANAINRNANTVLLAVITSKGTNKIYPHQCRVADDLLPKLSKVKCDNLIMWPKEELRAKNYVGTISKKDIKTLDDALLKALDLWI